jgi:hypothetical protein
MNNTDKMMYGCDMEAFKESIKDSFTYKFQGGYMVVASLLSDAQEQLAHGQDFGARQTLNKAKALLFDIMEDKMSLQPSEELTYTRM